MNETTTRIPLNELQDLLATMREDAIRRNLKETVAEDVERSTSLIMQSLEPKLKLASLASALKSDAIENLIRLLRQEGLEADTPLNDHGVTAVHMAAYYRAIRTLQHFCSTPQINLSSKTVAGDTPLMYALCGAEIDPSALSLLRIFLAAQTPPSIAVRNSSHLTPLSIALQRGFIACAELLTVKPLLVHYTPVDLLRAIKIALVHNRDELVHDIRSNWPVTLEQEVCALSSRRTVDRLDFLHPKPSYSRLPSLAIEVADERAALSLADYLPTASTFTALDAQGRRLKPGDVVQTLGCSIVSRALRSTASADTRAKVADSAAVVQEVLPDDRLYIEMVDKNFVTHIRGIGVRFQREGPSMVLADHTFGRVGTYVRVIQSADDLKSLLGQAGWLHGMEETCGRTGKIVRIFNEDVLVQFGWGPRYYYKPQALLHSSPDKVETHDLESSAVMRKGASAILNLPRDQFSKLQLKYGLPYDGEYAFLPMKHVTFQRAVIKAFSPRRIVQVLYNDREYLVNLKCLTLVNTVPDGRGGLLQLGDKVKIMGDTNKLATVQTPEYGGWVNALTTCVDQVGTLTHIRPSVGAGSGVLVQVEFPESKKTFYFNPVAVTGQGKATPDLNSAALFQTVRNLSMKSIQEALATFTPKEERILEQIKREDLRCYRKLGEGSFGAVFRAEWMMKGGEKREVAVKKVKVQATMTISVAAIMKEAETQFELAQHPNIVSIFGVSYRTDLWIVLEYVDGVTLEDFLFPDSDEDVELTAKQEAKLCLDMCNAVAYVHNKGYVHCDIKPMNMMVERRTGKLYIMDFGITRYLGTTNLMDFATQYTNSLTGTVYYLPPESLVADDRGRYRRPKFPVDVWALGVVIYEIYTLSDLAENDMEFLHDKVMRNESKIKRKLSSQLPPSVHPMVSSALDFNPKARPTAQELAEFFHEFYASLG